MNPHPDDQIFKVKDFINELSKVQDRYFKKLCKKLNVPKETEDYLFDYIYNEDKMVTFGEYLDKLGRGELWDGL
jgi:hypothetical protein